VLGSSNSKAELAFRPLTADEVERGFVEFHCDVHGGLVATTPNATVWCSCGKRVRHQRHGRLVDPDTLKPTAAKARKLNSSGQPFIHGCGDCGQDFQGVTLQKRHRVGRSQRRCLTPTEMFEKGWALDEHGRWRNRANNDQLRRLATEREQTPKSAHTAVHRLEPGQDIGEAA
jgi:hypothetical protein